MTTTDIATTDPAALPAIPTPASTGMFSAGDFPTPQITLVQGQSEFLTNREYGARNGDVIWHTDKTDLHYLIGGDDKAEEFVGFVVHWEKTAARFFGDGQMEFEQSRQRNLADPDSWDVFFYHIAIPAIDDMLAAKAMFTRSNLPAARNINLLFARAARETGGDTTNLPPIPVKFRTAEGVGKKGHQFFKYSATTTKDFTEDEFETAKLIQGTAKSLAAAQRYENTAPQVDDSDKPSI